MTQPPGNIVRIEIVLRKGQEELLPASLYDYSGSGIWIEERGEFVSVKVYPDDTERFLRKLQASGLGIREVHIEKEEVRDYAEIARQHFKPLRIGDVTVVAPWSKSKAKGEKIVIEPGMAFGTGRHESTALMLKMMGALELEGRRVAELGCGSGILSIYAVLRGARSVFAVDNDQDAVVSAKRNLSLNRVRRVKLACADLRCLRGSFDVVLANLDRALFERHAPHVEGLVAKEGHLVISGILKKDGRSIPALFPLLSLKASEQRNAWLAFAFARA